MRAYRNSILDEASFGGLPKISMLLSDVSGSTATDLMTEAAGTGYPGTFVGSVSRAFGIAPVNGSRERTLRLDGSSAYVTHNVPSLGTSYSVEAWAKFDSTSGNMIVAASRTIGNPVWYQLDRNGLAYRLIARDDAGHIATASSGNVAVANQWVHLAGVRSGNTLAVYVNGALAGTASATFGSITPMLGTIGITSVDLADASKSFMAGEVFDFRLHAYALAADRIQAHYLAGINGGFNHKAA